MTQQETNDPIHTENEASEKKHNFFERKSPRAFFHDYCGKDYFVTICTANKEHYFGHIYNEEMHYTEVGKFANDMLSALGDHYKYIKVLSSVVMPNHIHAIISITEEDAPMLKRETLGVVMGGYKQSVTRFARLNHYEFGWQPRYHDHIIRDKRDGNNIATYIENNVAKWEMDTFYK
jgi:REP element-mobilizing transposase RayT